MYIVIINGPKPIVMPIRDALNEDDASAKALAIVNDMLPTAVQGSYKVERVYGPEDIPEGVSAHWDEPS